MRILPVMDLLNGLVVHAKAGKREAYRPIESKLAPDAFPDSVAGGIAASLQLSSVYVAELDAIQGRDWHRAECAVVARHFSEVWLDVGLSSEAGARQLCHWCRGVKSRMRPIVALETMASPGTLAGILRVIPPEDAIFSLDLVAGRPILASDAWNVKHPRDIIDHVIECGVRSVVVLDVADVGLERGLSTLRLCEAILQRHRDVQVATGGGVRDRRDLLRLAQAGCHTALVGTALHAGRVTRQDVQACARIDASGIARGRDSS